MTDSPALENEPQYPPDKEPWHIYGLIKREWDEIRDIARGEERKRITDILLHQIDVSGQSILEWGDDPMSLIREKYYGNPIEEHKWLMFVLNNLILEVEEGRENG